MPNSLPPHPLPSPPKTHIGSPQSPRHHLPVVPQPAESHPLPGVQPLQVADHQDRAGPAAAHHAGPLPVQHAGLPRQEAARSLKGCWEGLGGGWPAGWMDEWMGGILIKQLATSHLSSKDQSRLTCPYVTNTKCLPLYPICSMHHKSTTSHGKWTSWNSILKSHLTILISS